ncbi:protein PHOTOPERIOD-INDEPENDENT EARLY FLOWERING 1 [Cucurbita moschata]|uniref:DNA helicase n=1 Tax=Cucurbita moschata TaxID=3662 RepID=A0A6J1FNW1_CUCMO|nr:protein PHOTOPERIOD-INDEPENDENT EARLY FLOWERING 1 [Cucurbita moschata]XP_022940298.1 protein PHOTOPERIOD-INDEPENDENT EARLY FLOWERING 1 [Cucurbita moschata]
MASKGPRFKLDHETRAKRQKTQEAPREPNRPKTHWDHVLEEMVWLSKDFESERKWKLAQAKKVALRASKGMIDQATREERKLKEEEQRLRKLALNISKDVKKFWMKIEKLVLYKHQMELDEKKKKALDKHLEFLLGQTERYSTMLAENLVETYKPSQVDSTHEPHNVHLQEMDENKAVETTELNVEHEADSVDFDEEFDVRSDDESEDNEQTIDEDEALITEEERQEELEALQNEVDLPLEELLKRYAREKDDLEVSPETSTAGTEETEVEENHERGNECSTSHKVDEMDSLSFAGRRCNQSNGESSCVENHMKRETCRTKRPSMLPMEFPKDDAFYDFSEEREDDDYDVAGGEEKDDEATLSEEEKLEKVDSNNADDEILMLRNESEIPIEELLARYGKGPNNGYDSDYEDENASALSDDLVDSSSYEEIEPKPLNVCVHENIDPGKSHSSASSPPERKGSLENSEERESEDRIFDAAAAARSAQPTGNTFSTTKVRTKFPFLLKHSLREYQHIGLDWLVTMYEKRLNGILADEMGLGKTIMTIALLAHLACEKGIWGPHLIVVPTSVMLNWETEFLKWCPAFKILTYFGSAKERKFKRQGWMKLNSFHVCITTYRLVIQDSKVFKRKKWKYLILDEAHLIKNWKSQRWQTLLNFNSKRRILLTGTPLQNDLMELWSLMHFLMPHIFQSHQEFKDWFCNPISGMVEGQEKVNKEVLDRLHNVLRPFILRRLKRDVEKQLPKKYEHVLNCRLSRRQRHLYEDYIASSETQATLASGNFFSMINVIMQLRKVCNHPDLFEGRPIISSFDMAGIVMQLSSSVCSALSPDLFSRVDLKGLGFLFTHHDFSMTSWERDEVRAIATPSNLIKCSTNVNKSEEIGSGFRYRKRLHGSSIFADIQNAIMEERVRQAMERAEAIAWWNSLKCDKKPIYSASLRDLVTIRHPIYDIYHEKANPSSYCYSSKIANIVLSPVERFQMMMGLVESFTFAIPAARAPPPLCWCSGSRSDVFMHPSYVQNCSRLLFPLLTPIRSAIIRRQVYFPDRRLIQFDCGKLQELAILLRKLKSEGHRALIFTQMTKMLDILEAFINLYGYTYMRLDGSTQPEERQTLMQRFNTNPKFFLFILSTRSGGVGINLVGADTVIFYDSDWNPAMDQQAQDRCHRIGQTREVHIYRLISESTIEENILKKANQKRALDNLVIQSGSYNTEFFQKLDPMELFSGHRSLAIKNMQKEKNHTISSNEVSVSNADVDAALKFVEDEADYMALKKLEEEEAVDNQEFTEEVIGRMEDDEFMNDDEIKLDEGGDQAGGITMSNKDNEAIIRGGNDLNEEKAVIVANKEDDVDMLADIKQMAAVAAATGQTISSIDDQLRPIDRYAIRFLELWDPLRDKAAMDSDVQFEETEWELDRLEKYKEEMEAEIDEDEEPLVYESWDADFATEAYRQQVEVLAHHQLMEDLEYEAKRKEEEEAENCDPTRNATPSELKPKSKKKSKKAKFKSLKKGSLSSELKSVKKEMSVEFMSTDDEDLCSEDVLESLSAQSSLQKKRKRGEFSLDSETGKSLKKKSKKFKKNIADAFPLDLHLSESGVQYDEAIEIKPRETGADLEHKLVGRSRMGGKISITSMPVKRVLMIKPEKIKKGNIWSRDCIPSPDFWLPQEDAILCAMVHEYGSHWSMISSTLFSMTAGGFYRGRYRHPVHCCERYRELIQRYVISAPDNPNSEKTTNASSGKALLRITEEHIRVLLDVAAEQPDSEYLLQKHFTALLSSVWKARIRGNRGFDTSLARNGLYSGGRYFPTGNHITRYLGRETTGKLKFGNTSHNCKLIAAALNDAGCTRTDDKKSLSYHGGRASVATEQLELTLEFEGENDINVSFPSSINLTVSDAVDLSPINLDAVESSGARRVTEVAEIRFRDAARTCNEDFHGWASSVFPITDLKARSVPKSQSLGKHKLGGVTESSKSSKSKFRKAGPDHGESSHTIADPVMYQMPSLIIQEDVHNLYSLSSPILTDDSFPFGMDEYPFLQDEPGTLEIVPDNDYILGSISGFDTIGPDFTDIG